MGTPHNCWLYFILSFPFFWGPEVALRWEKMKKRVNKCDWESLLLSMYSLCLTEKSKGFQWTAQILSLDLLESHPGVLYALPLQNDSIYFWIN